MELIFHFLHVPLLKSLRAWLCRHRTAHWSAGVKANIQ
jgi:hypothetical protein